MNFQYQTFSRKDSEYLQMVEDQLLWIEDRLWDLLEKDQHQRRKKKTKQRTKIDINRNLKYHMINM